MLAKYNLNHLKPDMREEWKRALAEEIVRNRGKVKGMRRNNVYGQKALLPSRIYY